MSDIAFIVRNSLVVNNYVQANSGGLYFANVLTLNSSVLTAAVTALVANNAAYLGGLPAGSLSVNNAAYLGGLISSGYQTTAGLSSNVAGLSSNNASYLGGVTSGSYVNTSGNYTISGVHTHNANLVANGIIANGSIGASNQVLSSNASVSYWATLAASAFTDTTNATNINTGSMSNARVSGLAPSATTDTTNATNITSGAMSNARVSGLAASATTDTTNATNITTGSMSNARVSGLAASATTDTTNAGNISSGTLNNSRLNTNVLFGNVNSQTISGGGIVTANSLSSGSFTANAGICPLQYITNNGAFTITAPSNDGSCVILLTNGGSAGTISFSGFSVGSSIGDPLDTTNGHKFMLYVCRINGNSTYAVKALQ